MRRAATYSRMSTEHQNYSLEHRRIKFQAFAAANALTITRQYVDHGKSGLDLKGRAGLQSLLADVTNQPDIDVILVYDVSRWGRFQDVDESAYYEYVCRRAGIPVLYCAEQFANDNTAISSILKALKRLMAAESRCWRRWRGANSPRVRLHSAPSTGEHTLDHACRNRTLPRYRCASPKPATACNASACCTMAAILASLLCSRPVESRCSTACSTISKYSVTYQISMIAPIDGRLANRRLGHCNGTGVGTDGGGV